MSEATTRATLTLEHTAMSEAEALQFLAGHRIMRGGRTMDPKAQIVGEFVKSIRVPGYFPPLPELRQQLSSTVSEQLLLYIQWCQEVTLFPMIQASKLI